MTQPIILESHDGYSVLPALFECAAAGKAAKTTASLENASVVELIFEEGMSAEEMHEAVCSLANPKSQLGAHFLVAGTHVQAGRPVIELQLFGDGADKAVVGIAGNAAFRNACAAVRVTEICARTPDHVSSGISASARVPKAA